MAFWIVAPSSLVIPTFRRSILPPPSKLSYENIQQFRPKRHYPPTRLYCATAEVTIWISLPWASVGVTKFEFICSKSALSELCIQNHKECSCKTREHFPSYFSAVCTVSVSFNFEKIFLVLTLYVSYTGMHSPQRVKSIYVCAHSSNS